jgi:hypothetical protein
MHARGTDGRYGYRKTENRRIILLAFVNISFAAIIIADHAKTASIRAKERSGLAEALAGLGIEIAAGDIPADTRLTATRWQGMGTPRLS